MKDIVLIISDQHCGFNTSIFDNETANTPNLKKLAETSTVFQNNYCNNPLCVPSRMSFLSGKESGDIKVLDNDALLPSSTKTIADKYSEAGYRTILVGRMHFKGSDQHHGFNERYVGDITTQYWKVKRNDLGVFDGTFKMSGCLKEYGYGDSPVEEFDEAVCEKAIALLKQEHDKPIFMVVGFYSPHFPYCAPKDLFNKYYNSIGINDNNLEVIDYYKDWQQNINSEELKNVRSSYYGMIESLDIKIGKIKNQYDLSDLDGLFIYTSDHGDQIGKRNLFGKRTLYQESIKIPLLIEDKRKMKAEVINNEVSLLDLSQYLCNYANLESNKSGVNLLKKDSPVRVVSILNNNVLAQAIIYKSFKLESYNNKDFYMFDLKNDENEEHDIKEKELSIFNNLKNYLLSDVEVNEYISINIKQKKISKVLAEWTKEANPVDTVRYKFENKDLGIPKRGKR
jgi:choline-sulfatase